MGLPATKRTNLHEKYGASESAGNVSACRATGFQSKAHQSARKVRLPQPAGPAYGAFGRCAHALEIYFLAVRVEGLARGLYRYAPGPHTLTLLAGADRHAAPADAFPGQAWLRDAPAVLLVAGVVARTAPKYLARAARYVHIEAGHAAQNIYLQATALGLATVLVGAVDDNRLHAAMGLPDGHAPLAFMPVGYAR